MLGDDQEFEIANVRVKKSKYVPKAFDFDAMCWRRTQKPGMAAPKPFTLSVKYLRPLHRCLEWAINAQKNGDEDSV